MKPDAHPTREALAEYAHDAWSGWMHYLFSHCEEVHRLRDGTADSIEKTLLIPGWAVERWRRQMKTPFSALPDAEKQSDYEEADKILAIVEQSV